MNQSERTEFERLMGEKYPKMSLERYEASYLLEGGYKCPTVEKMGSIFLMAREDAHARTQRLVEAWQEYKDDRRDYDAWHHTRTLGSNITHPVHDAMNKMAALAAEIKAEQGGGVVEVEFTDDAIRRAVADINEQGGGE